MYLLWNNNIFFHIIIIRNLLKICKLSLKKLSFWMCAFSMSFSSIVIMMIEVPDRKIFAASERTITIASIKIQNFMSNNVDAYQYLNIFHVQIFSLREDFSRTLTGSSSNHGNGWQIIKNHLKHTYLYTIAFVMVCHFTTSVHLAVTYSSPHS